MTERRRQALAHRPHLSGFEKKVAESLVASASRPYGLQEEIGEVLIPTEDVVEMRAGKKVVSSKRSSAG